MESKAAEVGRRAVVVGGPLAAALSAAGCCTLPSTPRISGDCKAQSTFLAGPEVRAAWSRPERYFDAHTHFFNAQDVPVAGFLRKSVAHSIPSERVRKLVEALAPIAEALSHLAPTPSVEYEELCGSSDLLKSLSALNDELDSRIEGRRDAVATQLYRQILQSAPSVPLLFDEANAAALARNPGAMRAQTKTFSEEFVREALRDGSGYREPNQKFTPSLVEKMSVEEVEAASLKNALQFVGFMLSPRHHNLRTYIRRNAESSPSLPLSGCFASMVDFNYWLDCPDKASNLRDQVLLHEQLALRSNGFMLPLVAYNPWVDIQEADASIKTVRWAIEEHGCVGVKMYPPMGFYPYDNVGLPLQSNEPRPSPAALDEKLLALYELCDELGVPVMAHANESNGRDFEHDKLAGARGWAALRDKSTTLKRLHINAGHLGGDSIETTNDWTDDFVRLMSEPGVLRIYGDLGYWDKLVTDQTVQVNLKTQLSKRLQTGGIAAERIMYGSDWLMLSQVPGWERYGERISTLIRGIAPSSEAFKRVMGLNALECFGLNNSSQNKAFSRLRAYYTSRGLKDGPGWLT